MKKDLRSRSVARILRRLAVAAVLLILAPTLALPLYGWLRLASAISDLEMVLGRNLDLDKARDLPPIDAAVTRFGGGTDFDFDSSDWPAFDSEVRWAPVDRWSPQEKHRVRKLVERHGADLERWRQGLPGPRLSFRERDYGGSWVETGSLGLLRAAKLVRFDAQLALDDGDPARALADAATIARISACFDEGPWLISALLSVATEKFLLTLARELLESPRSSLDEAGLQKLETMLPTVDLQARALDAVEQEAVFSITVFGDGRPLADIVPPDEPIRLFFGRAAAAEGVHASRRAIERIPVPYGKFAGKWDNVSHKASFNVLIWTLQTWLADEMSLRESHKSSQVLGTGLEGNLLDAVVKYQIAASQRQLVQAAILLRRTGLAAGEYPPERPRVALLEDPDPFTGRRILYRPGDDGSLVLEHDGGVELARRFWPSGDKAVTDGAVHRIRLPPLRHVPNGTKN